MRSSGCCYSCTTARQTCVRSAPCNRTYTGKRHMPRSLVAYLLLHAPVQKSSGFDRARLVPEDRTMDGEALLLQGLAHVPVCVPMSPSISLLRKWRNAVLGVVVVFERSRTTHPVGQQNKTRRNRYERHHVSCDSRATQRRSKSTPEWAPWLFASPGWHL